ncbi:MAG: pilin [Microgenomates group bacterium]
MKSTINNKYFLARIDEGNPLLPAEGIYNPVINPNLGKGEGHEIIALLIANTLKILFSLVGVVLLAMLIWGSFRWLTAGPDKEKVAKAQGTITSALIGFLIFMSVFAIINFLAPALGFDFLQILKIEWPTP